MAKKKVFIKNTKNAKSTKNTKKSGKSSSKTGKTKRVARKPSAKKAARKPQGKKSAKSVAKKTTKKTVKKTAKKTVKKTAKKTVKKVATKATKKASKSPAKKKIASSPRPVAKKVVAKTVKKVAKSAEKKKRASSTRPARKLKSPLTKKQLQTFRALLMEKRKSLLGDMTGIESKTLGRNLQESSGDLSNMPTHPADIGSDNFEHEFTLGLLESERSLLQEIHEALERIDDGTYGACLGTGGPIGIPRLKARPWCKYCIEYQKMIEKGLVRPGQGNSFDSSGEEEDEMEDQED